MRPCSILVLAGMLILVLSCEKEDALYKEGVPGEIVSSWIDPVYSDSLITYTRATQLRNDDPGITFKDDGSLIERRNAGFCGTPPISYDDYDGSWSLEDSVISINTDFWGGTMDMEWGLMDLEYMGKGH